MTARRSASDSARSTTTLARDSSAALTSNDGFSVVAPISVTVPASTWGSSASCCALLKRWISSMNSTVRSPLLVAVRGRLRDRLAQLLDPRHHRRHGHEARAWPRSPAAAPAWSCPCPAAPTGSATAAPSPPAPAAAASPARALLLADELRQRRGRIRSASGCPRRSFTAARANRSTAASLRPARRGSAVRLRASDVGRSDLRRSRAPSKPEARGALLEGDRSRVLGSDDPMRGPLIACLCALVAADAAPRHRRAARVCARRRRACGPGRADDAARAAESDAAARAGRGRSAADEGRPAAADGRDAAPRTVGQHAASRRATPPNAAPG